MRRLPPDPSAAEVVAAALARSVARILEHEAGLRRGEDPEDVHQARVGARRLRSDLGTFRELLDPDWERALRDALRPWASQLGAVRDADVLLDRLREALAELTEKDRQSGGPLLRRLELERARAREALLAGMDGPAYALLRERLRVAADAPALRARAEVPALEGLAPLVARRWRRLARSVDALGATPEAAALHRVRIRAKRLRYAVEALAPVAGRRARAFAKALARIQGVLGEHQDATVAVEWLREAARSSPPNEAFVAGALAARERRCAEEAQARWAGAWQRASRPKLRRWL